MFDWAKDCENNTIISIRKRMETKTPDEGRSGSTASQNYFKIILNYALISWLGLCSSVHIVHVLRFVSWSYNPFVCFVAFSTSGGI